MTGPIEPAGRSGFLAEGADALRLRRSRVPSESRCRCGAFEPRRHGEAVPGELESIELMDRYQALGALVSAPSPVIGRVAPGARIQARVKSAYSFRRKLRLRGPSESSGYRSHHATVRGPGGGVVEVQLRALPMHTVAERGSAAHRFNKSLQPGDRAAPLGIPLEVEDAHKAWFDALGA